jgi:hypothetical protein
MQHEPAVLPPLTHMDIDIEIDIADAGLFGAVRATFMPAAATRAGVSDIGKPQTAPVRQLARALAGELPRQHDFLAAFAGADDVRTQFAGAAVITAHDLLLREDGMAKEAVGGAGHWDQRLLACYPGLRESPSISI